MSTCIRAFTEADAAPANALTNIFIRETHIHFAAEPGDQAAFLESWRQRQPRFPWLAACIDGEFAGYAKSTVWRQRDAYRFTAESAVYIHPRFHRRGIGRALMLELLERLTGAGFHTVVAGVALPNPASIALHEAIHFQPAGTFQQVGFKFGKWWDVGFWQKHLVQPPSV